MNNRLKCWEFFHCTEKACPVFKTKNHECWLVSGTHCHDAIQGKFLEKIEMCLDCEPFKANIDRNSLSETLMVVQQQFKEFRRMVAERDRELEETSLELALGLSEVFEALKRIAAGDPLVRVPEGSKLELIDKLKHMVNLTAKNLGEMVDLSHEFAIGLAEHFDALHRVSEGDLSARIYGLSRVELLESLKKVTNQMIQSVAREISHREHAESALRESEEKYRHLVENVNDVIYATDERGIITYISPVIEAVTGHKPSEIIGKGFTEFAHEKDISYVMRWFNNVLSGHVEPGEYRITTKSGQTRWVRMSSQPVMMKDRLAGLQGVLTDLTERKQAEDALQRAHDELETRIQERTSELRAANKLLRQEIGERQHVEAALRASEARLRTLFEEALNPIMIVDKKGRYIDANRSALEFLECDRDELLGSIAWHFSPPGQTRGRHNKLTPLMGRGTIETDCLVQGRTKTLLLNVVPLTISGEMIVYCIGQNITKRREAEKALQESEQKYRSLVESTEDSIYLVDRESTYLFINNRHLSKLGMPFDEAVGKTYDEHHSEPETKEFKQKVQEVFQTGQSLWHEYKSPRDGRYFLRTLSPVKEAGGEVIAVTVVSKDITERKLAEEALKKSREQLRNLSAYLQSAREQERTSIAREVHDDLGQTLTALKMDLSWLNKKLPHHQEALAEKTRAMMKLVDGSIQSVQRISSDLRPGLLDDLGLTAAIEWQAEEFQNRSGIQCDVSFDPEDMALDRNLATTIFRIFQETLTNVARHANASRVDAKLIQKENELVLRVKDNGKGITIKQISDPKAFGLVGMRERAYVWGGEVNISGTPDSGTTVEVRIPVNVNNGAEGPVEVRRA